jgi:hypothetical protein
MVFVIKLIGSLKAALRFSEQVLFSNLLPFSLFPFPFPFSFASLFSSHPFPFTALGVLYVCLTRTYIHQSSLPLPIHKDVTTMSSSAHFPDSQSFQQQSNEFISWLEASPGVKVNPKIILADLRSTGAGRGVGKSTPSTHHAQFHRGGKCNKIASRKHPSNSIALRIQWPEQIFPRAKNSSQSRAL